MDIFTKDGWLNVPELIKVGMPFIFCTGARGVGKTYGTLDYFRGIESQYIYMRRTMTELDVIIDNEALNPFAQLNADQNINIGFVRNSKYTALITNREKGENDKLIPCGRPLGLAMALSAVAKMRGFSGIDYDCLFYDEFIPESHVQKIRNESDAFLNAYETINRNRELFGRKPLQVICMSNSNKLDNALYFGLNLVSKVDEMKRKHKTTSIIRSRGILLVNIEKSPISERKRNTALYRLSEGTSFAEMALDNVYIGEDDATPVVHHNLQEFTPWVAIGELCIYRHKSKMLYYVTTHVSGSPPTYTSAETDCKRFRNAYGIIWSHHMARRVDYDSRICEILLRHYLGIK